MKYYILDREISNKSMYLTYYEDIKPINLGDAPKCVCCGKYLGLLTWLPPYRVNLELWGDNYGDIAWGSGSDLLISERFLSMYKNYGFIGLSGFDPVEIIRVKWKGKYKNKQLPIPHYYRVIVERSQTAIDQKSSGLIYENNVICKVCRQGDNILKFNRVIIEFNTWDGKDIFIARGLPGIRLVTNTFKRACEEAGIRNVLFMDAEKYSIDYTFGINA